MWSPIRLRREWMRWLATGLVMIFWTVSAQAAEELRSKPASPAREWLDLGELLGSYGLQGEWVEPGIRQRFKSAWTEIEFTHDSREILFNGLRVFLGDGCVRREGRLAISAVDARKHLGPLLRARDFAGSARPVRRIVIDAGHGGKDRGTGNAELKLMEKTFTLDVARRLSAILRRQGFDVVMTREDDTYLELRERARLTRSAAPDLFVSIHFNATSGKPHVRGTETYVLTPQYQRSTSSARAEESDNDRQAGNSADPWNAVLGWQMHRALTRELGSIDRGLKRARFAVLRLIDCPGVLVEAGYLTNEAEARQIATVSYRDRIAEAAANGIIAFADQVAAVVKDR